MSFLGSRLREMRKRRGHSLDSFSELCGIPKSTIAMCERGQRNPKHELVENMARALGCDVDYLMGRTNVPITEKPIEDIFAGLTDKERELFELIRSLPPEQFEKTVEEMITFVDNFK